MGTAMAKGPIEISMETAVPDVSQSLFTLGPRQKSVEVWAREVLGFRHCTHSFRKFPFSFYYSGIFVILSCDSYFFSWVTSQFLRLMALSTLLWTLVASHAQTQIDCSCAKPVPKHTLGIYPGLREAVHPKVH